MRIVFVTYDHLPAFTTPEGWFERTRMYSGIPAALAKQHEVVSVNRIGYKGSCCYNGVTYHFTGLEKDVRYFFRFNQFVRSLTPDAVVINGTHYPLQLIHLRMLLGNAIKIAVHHHAELPFNGFKRYLQRWADRYTDAYFFASDQMGLDWVNRGNLASPDKISEVMEVSSLFYPVDRDKALARTGAYGQPVFIWVGRLNENKDPLNVVRAFMRYTEHKPTAKLYMFYHTCELLEQIKELIDCHPNRQAIELMGQVPNNDLLYWYNSADFIISGSHYEGANTAVCEAMSCGCIPVVTDIASFRMMTGNGLYGVLYKPGDEDGLLRGLLQLPHLEMQQKRQTCIQYFKDKLSFEAIAAQFDRTLSSLLDK